MKDPAKKIANIAFGNFHLLAVSVDKYDHRRHFDNTFHDTEELIRVLQEKYRFQEKHCVWLADEKATWKNIDSALQDYLPSGDRPLNKDDFLLVWLSGHGENHQHINGEIYFVPVDGEVKSSQAWYSYNKLKGYFLNINAKQILLISDSCFSGGMFKSGRQRFKKISPIIAKIIEKRGRRGISAGGESEIVSEAGGANNHSIFASALIDALEHNTDDWLLASELYSRIFTFMEECATQIPQYNSLPGTGCRGGQFVFLSEKALNSELVEVSPSGTMGASRSLVKSILFISSLLLITILALFLINFQQTTFYDVISDGSPAPEMVIIPAGSIKAIDTEGGSSGSYELSLNRRIAVSASEITWSEYSACIKAGGCKQNPHDFIIYDDHPVRGVSWDEANDYVNWLSDETVQDYRLLTSQEWEYVARAGNNDDQLFLDRLSADEAVIGNTKGLTKSVKADAPNNFGLYGMHGNVSEWTSSCYRESDGECTEHKIIRGSSWSHEKGRNDYREIEYNDPKIGLKYVGFRIAREID